jgi:hypothetical protein
MRAVVRSPCDDYRSAMAHHARLYYRLPRWFPAWRDRGRRVTASDRPGGRFSRDGWERCL